MGPGRHIALAGEVRRARWRGPPRWGPLPASGSRGGGGPEVTKTSGEAAPRTGGGFVRRGGERDGLLGRLLENVSFGCVILLLCLTQTIEWISDLSLCCWR